jgi:hypothetical protein
MFKPREHFLSVDQAPLTRTVEFPVGLRSP